MQVPALHGQGQQEAAHEEEDDVVAVASADVVDFYFAVDDGKNHQR